MKYTSQNLELYYSETGNPKGIPIVLIHGFGLSHAMWAPQIESLGSLCRVIAYDVRGHGLSGVGDGQYSMELYVDDLIALLDHLSLPTAILCGLSMGGYIALRATERNPARIRGLILADTRSEADSNEAKLKRASGMQFIKKQGLAEYAKLLLPAVLAPRTLKENPAVANRIVELTAANNPLGVCGALLAMAGRLDTTAFLPQIKIPTLFVSGDQDALIPPTVPEANQRKVPGSQFLLIPQAGHISNLENSSSFSSGLLNWLSQFR